MTPSATAIPAATFTGEPPIIVVTTDYHNGQGGKATIHLVSLNYREYHREIVAENVWHVCGPIMDDKENVYVPIKPFDPFGRSDIVLKRLYYSYFEAEEVGSNILYTRLGMSDTENEEELHTYSKCCPPPDGYQQYKEYLFVDHSSEAGGCALLLSMKDLSPVVDLYELLKGEGLSKISIVPFGKSLLWERKVRFFFCLKMVTS